MNSIGAVFDPLSRNNRGILASILPFLSTEHTDSGEYTVKKKPCLLCFPWLFSTTLKGGNQRSFSSENNLISWPKGKVKFNYIGGFYKSIVR